MRRKFSAALAAISWIWVGRRFATMGNGLTSVFCIKFAQPTSFRPNWCLFRVFFSPTLEIFHPSLTNTRKAVWTAQHTLYSSGRHIFLFLFSVFVFPKFSKFSTHHNSSKKKHRRMNKNYGRGHLWIEFADESSLESEPRRVVSYVEVCSAEGALWSANFRSSVARQHGRWRERWDPALAPAARSAAFVFLVLFVHQL